MPRYNVTKVMRLQYEVEAENEEAALAVPWPREDPDAASIIREWARDLDKPAGGPRVIADREMRAGRVFTRTYKGKTFTATIRPDGKVKLSFEGTEGGPVSGFYGSLHQATAAAILLADGKPHSANAWQFWQEVEQAAKPSKKTAGPP